MAHGLTVRANAGCGFHLATKGGFDGAVGEIGSGQARAGSDMKPSIFTWFGDAFVDQLSRGCWWTPPSFVLQCDFSQQPDHGFQIGCNGEMSFNGQSTFYECPTGDGDQVNIYLGPNGGNCSEITLQADDCQSPCSGTAPSQASPTAPPPSSPPNPSAQAPGTSQPSSPGASQTTPVSTQPTTSPTACTTVGPDEIILIDKGNPDKAYGPNNAMYIQVSPNASSIFNFRFADSDAGKTCELFFAIGPGRPYYLAGTGVVDFAALDGWADANTTYGTAPRAMRALDAVALGPGMSRGLGAFACPGSRSRNSILVAEAPYADTCFECLQGGVGDGAMIGLYMSKC
ncbi:ubiquitin 3 binding protein But2 C-terminal domain-containing protein [Biscogniauxia marginata]|nr:ubiquitin 3 binding protein But2 C-terminal domain-containing protein [Biscogniauxia marginata]